jgi:hypothetical protein
MRLDSKGRPMRGASATLLVSGNPAVPQGYGDPGDLFREAGDRCQYGLKLSGQGVSGASVALTISVSDGTTHALTRTVVRPPAPPDRH